MNICLFFFIFLFVIVAGVNKDENKINQNQSIEGNEMVQEDTSITDKNQQSTHYINEKQTKPFGFVIKNVLYHNSTCFTQGLLVDPKTENLIESCGQYGQSYIKVYNPQKKKVYSRKYLPSYIFGEGIGLIDGTLLALSWREQAGFIYRLENSKLKLKRTISYKTSNNEGWGVTTGFWKDQPVYFVSDGSCNVMVWEKDTFEELHRECIVDPFNENQPLQNINELEFVGNVLFANIWMDDHIALINYEEGKVIKWIDFGILQKWIRHDGDSYQQTNRVLNGIAYNAATHSLYITGKLWNRMFEIELIDSFVY